MAGLLQSEPVVLHLKHHLKGDDANAFGIALALADRLGGRVVSLECGLRTTALVPVVRAMLRRRRGGAAGRDLSAGMRWWSVLFDGEKPPVGPVSAVVSTLGRGETPAAYISSYWGVPAIHLGSPKRMTQRELAIILTHQGQSPNPGEIVLPISPTRIVRRAAKPVRKDLVLVLAGGDAEGISYSEPFWSNLIGHANAVAQSMAQGLAVITSPRTGDAEKHIEATARDLGLPQECLVLYGRPAKRAYPELLSAAAVVFVTAESVSMISDAVAAGAKVVAVHQGELPRSDRIRRFIGEQLSYRHIGLLDLSQPDPASDFSNIEPLESCWSDLFWEQVRSHFVSTK